MTWRRLVPWLRRRDARGDDARDAQASQARKDAEEQLHKVRQQWPAVHQAARDLDALGDAIARAMRGRA